MKALLFVALAFFSGCSGLGIRTWEAAEADRAKQRANADAREQIEMAYEQNLNSLAPDMSSDQVLKLLGQPVAKEFDNDQFVWRYSHRRKPMILKFNRANKLVGWKVDMDIVNFRRAKDSENRQYQAMEDQADAARRATAVQNINNALSPKTCNSTKQFDGSVKTVCN